MIEIELQLHKRGTKRFDKRVSEKWNSVSYVNKIKTGLSEVGAPLKQCERNLFKKIEAFGVICVV